MAIDPAFSHNHRPPALADARWLVSSESYGIVVKGLIGLMKIANITPFVCGLESPIGDP